MSLTRKHFVEIAAALLDAKPRSVGLTVTHDKAIAIEAHKECCESIADMLARTNPAFDRARFLAACGVAAPRK